MLGEGKEKVMGKAFQCDSCLECFPGNAHHTTSSGKEICSGCRRVFEAFAGFDPLANSVTIKLKSDSPVAWTHTHRDFPLHTGEHNQ